MWQPTITNSGTRLGPILPRFCHQWILFALENVCLRSSPPQQFTSYWSSLQWDWCNPSPRIVRLCELRIWNLHAPEFSVLLLKFFNLFCLVRVLPAIKWLASVRIRIFHHPFFRLFIYQFGVDILVRSFQPNLARNLVQHQKVEATSLKLLPRLESSCPWASDENLHF